MSKISEHKFTNREELIIDLKDNVIDALGRGLNDKGEASMLLSGGTTPGALYHAMSQSELDWEKAWFAPTDERWVEPDHKDSNEKLIRDTLIQNKAAGANYIRLKSSPDNPRDGQSETEQFIMRLPQPFDVVLLGMGEDGHTASLFPNLSDTDFAIDEECDAKCAPISRGNGEVDRMTMTLNCLLNAKKIILYFYGEKKLAVFEEAKKIKTSSLPVSYLLHQNKTPVELYWAE